jgi:hypothetical protein
VVLADYHRVATEPTAIEGEQMEGTWDMRVTPRDCQTGRSLGTFRALSTFSCGGTMIEVDAGEPPGRRSTGQGSWRHLGERCYETVLRFFVFHPDGTHAETQKVTRLIELSADGDEFSATASVEVFDADDSIVRTLCATTTARRIRTDATTATGKTEVRRVRPDDLTPPDPVEPRQAVEHLSRERDPGGQRPLRGDVGPLPLRLSGATLGLSMASNPKKSNIKR